MKVNLQSDSRPNSLIHSFRHPVIQIASVLLPIFKFSNQQTFKSLQLCCPFSNFQINKLSNCFSFAAHFQIFKSKNLQIASALLPFSNFQINKLSNSFSFAAHFQIVKSKNLQIAYSSPSTCSGFTIVIFTESTLCLKRFKMVNSYPP